MIEKPWKLYRTELCLKICIVKTDLDRGGGFVTAQKVDYQSIAFLNFSSEQLRSYVMTWDFAEILAHFLRVQSTTVNLVLIMPWFVKEQMPPIS